jgi:hypothetical protein
MIPFGDEISSQSDAGIVGVAFATNLIEARLHLENYRSAYTF